MVIKSKFPPLDIPKCNILSYLFAPDQSISKKPLWIDAADTSKSLSPSQMLAWIKRFAVGLTNLGIDENQAIMVFTPNHIYVPMIYLAVTGSKRFFTGANPNYTTSELAHQMKAIEAAIVLIHPTLLRTGLAAAKEAGIPASRLFQLSDSECVPSFGVRDWRSIIPSEAEAASWQWDPLIGEGALGQVAAINFSSGTTGLPKGVCITHQNLVSNASQVIFAKLEGTQYSKTSTSNPGDEKWLAFLPLYHAYSQLFTINIACKLQVPVYIMPKFVYKDFLSYIERFGITSIQAVPPVLIMLSKRPETIKYDISSVKHIMCGAAPLSNKLQNSLNTRFKFIVTQSWGMTETTTVGIMMSGTINDQTGSIGYLVPNTEATIVDLNGKEVSTEGRSGELWLRGPQVMAKYWKNEEATNEILTADGWLKTGDIAVTRDDKWWIVDRRKELIKVNGLQVSPAELEAVLVQSPNVADAAVVGILIHDEELPRAYVVLQQYPHAKLTEKHIQNFVQNRVAKHKRLLGGVKFVKEIPRLPSGKIMRTMLKEWAKRDADAVEGRGRPKL